MQNDKSSNSGGRYCRTDQLPTSCAASRAEKNSTSRCTSWAGRWAITAWLQGESRKQLDRLTVEKDIPMHALPA
jgi:hypothetical protein